MAFEKAFENTYDELSKNTQYRFAELELSKAVKNLTDILGKEKTPRQTAIGILWNIVTPHNYYHDKQESDFHQMCNTNYFNNPPKEEIIKYMIIHGRTYKNIRDLTSASFNTISKLRFGLPEYQPLYLHWNETFLSNWNAVKHNFNLWNESLVHNN